MYCRFAPPKTDLQPWSGIRNATEYAPACLQSKAQFEEQDRLLLKLLPEVQFSEDCLYLNIFKPDGKLVLHFCFRSVVYFHEWKQQGRDLISFAYRKTSQMV